jgi:hypothetical protein
MSNTSDHTGKNSFFRLLLSKYWMFLIVGILAGCTGILYAWLQPNQYKSKLTFSLSEGGSTLSSLAGLASEMGINIGGGDESIFSGDNIIEILRSRRIVEGVLLSEEDFAGKKMRMIDRYMDVTGMRKDKKIFEETRFPLSLPKENFSYRQDSVLMLVYSDLVKNFISCSRPDRRMNIYEINVTSLDEKWTRVFTDRMLERATQFYTEIRTKKAKNTLSILEERLADMKGNFDQSLETSSLSQDANLNPAFAETQLPVVKSQTDMQVYMSAYTELFKNLEIARFQFLNEIPVIQVVDGTAYPMENNKKGKLVTGLFFAILSAFLLILFFWIRRELQPRLD